MIIIIQVQTEAILLSLMLLGYDSQTTRIKQGMGETRNTNSCLGLYIAADLVKGSLTLGGLVINLLFILIQKAFEDAESLLSH